MEEKIINNRPVKIWTDFVEDSAMKQIENLTTLPFLFHHLAIMPDVHTGMGMPIGGVLACRDAVIPNAVGVDIGCGMCAVKTSWKVSEIPVEVLRKKIMKNIRESHWARLTIKSHRLKNTCLRGMISTNWKS